MTYVLNTLVPFYGAGVLACWLAWRLIRASWVQEDASVAHHQSTEDLP